MDRVAKGGEEAKKRKKPHRSCDAMWETGKTLFSGKRKNIDKKGFVQQLPTQII